MAVFPTARRAFARPAHLPWLIAAAVLLTITLTVSVAALVVDRSPRVEPPAAGGEQAAVAELGPATRSETAASVQAVGVASDGRALDAAPASYEALASDLVLAVRETSRALSAAGQLLAETVQAEAEARAVSEVSAEPVQVVAEPASEASASVVAEPNEPAPATDGQAETGAPASETQLAAETASPVESAPPAVQALPVAPAGPVQRWAAAGIVIETQGQALDDTSLANVDAALGALPASVVGALGNPALGPLHILVNTEGRVLSGDQPYGGPANFFSTNEGRNELVLYPQQSVFTIVHELGHAYNLRRIAAGRYAMVLLDPEMRSFLDATGWQIRSTDQQISTAVDHMHVAYTYTGSFHWPRLSNDDPLEDFANSFAMYFLDPAGLKQISPERYAWMAGTFGR